MCFRLCLLLLLAAAPILHAQVNMIVPASWNDDMNIRLHISESKLGNWLWSGQIEVADPHANFAGIFRYGSIPGSFHRVTAKHFRLAESRLLLDDKSPASLARRLAEIEPYATLAGRVQLDYDSDGYLLRSVRDQYTGDSMHTIYDIVDYDYTRSANGRLRVNITAYERNHNRNLKPPNGQGPFASTQYCGSFDTGPLLIRKHSQTMFEFDAAGRPLLLRSRTRDSVNACPDYDSTTDWSRTFRYDKNGRLIEAVDSTPLATHRMRYSVRYQYRDEPLSTNRYFRQPLTRQYLSTLDHPYQSRITHTRSYWEPVYVKDSPGLQRFRTVTEHFSTVRDRSHRMRIKLDERNDQEPFADLYQEGLDSLGAFRVVANVYLNIPYTNIPDTTKSVYDPRARREPEMIESGDPYGRNRETWLRYPRPAGTFDVRSSYCSDRSEIRDRTGWRIISYGPSEGGCKGIDCWLAPMHPERFCYSATDPIDFILIDPDGKLRYIYDSGDFYKIE